MESYQKKDKISQKEFKITTEQSRLIKYILVGLYNTFFIYCLYSVFYYFLENYTISYTLAYIITTIKSFYLYQGFVFKSKRSKKLFAFFIGGHILQYSLGVVLFSIFIAYIGLNSYSAGLLVTSITALLSFLYNRFIFIKII